MENILYSFISFIYMSDEHQDKDFRREMPPDMRIPDYQTWDIGGKITVENSDKTNKFYLDRKSVV